MYDILKWVPDLFCSEYWYIWIDKHWNGWYINYDTNKCIMHAYVECIWVNECLINDNICRWQMNIFYEILLIKEILNVEEKKILQ